MGGTAGSIRISPAAAAPLWIEFPYASWLALIEAFDPLSELRARIVRASHASRRGAGTVRGMRRLRSSG